MGITQRREREKQELREAILAAAREIALQDGWPSVTVRKVADRIEYSPPMIYEHFESKDGILIELTRQGFGMLLKDLQLVTANTTDPEARLLAIADTYWAFAWKYPELYQVMNGLGGVPFCETRHYDEVKKVFAFAIDAVQKLFQSMNVIGNDPEEAVKMIWATAHGFVALTMAGIMIDKQEGKYLVERAIRDFLAGWRARGTA